MPVLHSARPEKPRSMAKILMIADDLTGAADCGVAFAGCGTEAIVLLNGPGGRIPDSDWKARADVLAIDANTRCLAPGQAADVVERIVHSFCGHDDGFWLLFKKVDSTLRGNVGAELAAALGARRACARSSARVAMLFAPAFPAQGRTTVNGIQMVNGRPLEQAGPRLESVLKEAGLSCGVIDLATVRAGSGDLKMNMLQTGNEVDALICDAETEYDLRAIAQAGMMLGRATVWAGSAGLARHLPHAMGLAGSAAKPRNEIARHGPTLFVVGSPASVSREQARALAAEPGVACFTLVANAISSGAPFPDSHPVAAKVMDLLTQGADVLVQLECADQNAVNQDGELAQWLGRAIGRCAPKVGALVATGGETARAILDAWGIQSMTLVGEMEPGVPYSVAECGGCSLLVLTKAGGFGTPETLLRCREFLRQPGRMADKDGTAPIEGRKN